ncbi:ABC transporter substrate-binding protein [Cytobacillus dafuensis]|nr:ABC transporter substrate-binding protein [Cytobacillus dafuensis]
MRKYRMIKSKLGLTISILFIIALVAGCSSSQENKDGNKSIKAVLNWYAQPAHGGLYAADSKEFYDEAGLDVKIEQGGPQVSPTQIVASGKAQFGISHADEILIAVDEGLPLVAVAASFQTTQQAFAFHKGQDIKDIPDFNNRTVFVTPGAGYWEFLKQKYDLSNVKEMAHTGTLINFIADEQAVAQVFAASEPFVLEKEGVDIDMLYLKDTGYSPYSNVIFTTEKFLKEDPEAVKAFVESTIKGWNYYNDHPAEVNKYLKEVNKDLDVELMAKEAEAQKEFIYDGDGKTHGVGFMKKESWEEMKEILLNLNLIKDDIDVSKVFTTEFLPHN